MKKRHYIFIIIGLLTTFYVGFIYYKYLLLKIEFDNDIYPSIVRRAVIDYILLYEEIPMTKESLDPLTVAVADPTQALEFTNYDYEVCYKDSLFELYLFDGKGTEMNFNFMNFLLGNVNRVRIFETEMTKERVFSEIVDMKIFIDNDECYDDKIRGCIGKCFMGFRLEYLSQRFGINFDSTSVLISPDVREDIFVIENNLLRFYYATNEEVLNPWKGQILNLCSDCLESLGDNYKVIYKIPIPVNKEDFIYIYPRSGNALKE